MRNNSRWIGSIPLFFFDGQLTGSSCACSKKISQCERERRKALFLSLREQRAGGCVCNCIKSIFTTVCKCMSLSLSLSLSLSRSFGLLDAHREQQRRLLILLLLLLPLRRERGGETFSISGAFAQDDGRDIVEREARLVFFILVFDEGFLFGVDERLAL